MRGTEGDVATGTSAPPRLFGGGGSESNVHWAFGAIALLLLFVNLLTPSLLSGGISPGGTFLSQAVLYVDLSTNDNLSFLVESNGHVTYDVISIGVNESTPLASLPGNTSTYRGWNVWQNVSQVVASTLSVNGTRRFVLNITAVYLSAAPPGYPTGSMDASVSRGVFAFGLGPVGAPFSVSVVPLYPLTGPAPLPGGTSVVTWTSSDLPGTLQLARLPTTVLLPGQIPSWEEAAGGAA